MTWIGIVILVVVGVALVIIPVLALVGVVTAMVEPIRVLKLRGPDPEHVLSAPPPLLREALDLGYKDLGVYVHESTLSTKYVNSILVSPDRLVALVITHAPRTDRRHVFVSVFPDGRTLRTCDIDPLADPTGLHLVEMFPFGSMRHRERFHRERIEELEEPIVAWNPPAIPRSLETLDRARVERLVAMGRARWRDAERTKYSYSPRGAMQLFGRGLATTEHTVTRTRQRIAQYEREEQRAGGVGGIRAAGRWPRTGAETPHGTRDEDPLQSA
ncbi:MAG: hypothetical protein AB7K52_08215 [Phycisphaerales bacterium]